MRIDTVVDQLREQIKEHDCCSSCRIAAIIATCASVLIDEGSPLGDSFMEVARRFDLKGLVVDDA